MRRENKQKSPAGKCPAGLIRLFIEEIDNFCYNELNNKGRGFKNNRSNHNLYGKK
jgi:hypothetical protein